MDQYMGTLAGEMAGLQIGMVDVQHGNKPLLYIGYLPRFSPEKHRSSCSPTMHMKDTQNSDDVWMIHGNFTASHPLSLYLYRQLD